MWEMGIIGKWGKWGQVEIRRADVLRDVVSFFLEDYVLFDCPGQVELFTHHGSLKKIFMRIQKMGYRVRSVFHHLVSCPHVSLSNTRGKESNLLMVSNLVLYSSSCSISQTLTPLPSLRSTFRPSCYP